MTRDQDYAKVIAVEGIAPSKVTINDGSYPYVSEICASVRADIDKDSKAYKLFEYLTSSYEQNVVEESFLNGHKTESLQIYLRTDRALCLGRNKILYK